MTASEIAFLAFGLLLGATGGAAAAVASRGRSRPPREIRVTVAPAPATRRPATLATYLAPLDIPPARGGPADPAELGADRDPEFRSARESARQSGEAGLPAASGGNGRGTRGAAAAAEEIPEPAPTIRTSVRTDLQGSRSPMSRRPMSRPPTTVGWRAIPVEAGRDPLLAELLGSPGRPSTPPAMVATVGARPTPRSEGEPAGVPAGGRGSLAPARSLASAPARDADPGPSARADGDPAPAAEPDRLRDSASSDARALDPCSGPRLLARERCEVAARARAEAADVAERLRAARRAYDDAAARAEAAAGRADPRAVRAAKEAAQDAFRVARASARSRAEAEAAARAWLDEINRINREAAAASREAARLAQTLAELGPEMERLATEADAARILAESAEEACLAARQALAECEETAAALDRAARPASEPTPQGAPGPAGPAPAAGAPEPPPTPILAFEDDTAALAVERGREAAILRLLRGDHAVLERLVARLAGPDDDEARRWRLLLADLVDAVIARAIEATALDFPEDDPFWGRFTPAECRDIAAALAALGYRFDGLGGFADGRVPSQRDLSLAVGYAGLDPMRIRTWPSEAELPDLFARVTIAADEFLTREAGGLTLSELVELLGQRADELADLWNAWGRVRPLLIELV